MWFDNLFTQHDINKDGNLDHDEAAAFAKHLHHIKNDGTEFDEARAETQWTTLSEGGHISQEKLWNKMLEKATAAGKIKA